MKKKKGTKGSRDRGIKTEAQVMHDLQLHLMVLEKEAKALCETVERTKQKLIEIITSQALTPTLSQGERGNGPDPQPPTPESTADTAVAHTDVDPSIPGSIGPSRTE